MKGILCGKKKRIMDGEISAFYVEPKGVVLDNKLETWKYVVAVIKTIDGVHVKYGMPLLRPVRTNQKFGRFLRSLGCKVYKKFDTKELVGRKVRVLFGEDDNFIPPKVLKVWGRKNDKQIRNA